MVAISARVRTPALQCHTDTRSIIEARNTRYHRISLAIRPVKAAIALATYSTCAHRLQMHLLTRAGSVAPKVSVRTHTIRRWCAWRIGLAWAGRQSILTDHCSCGRATRRGSPQLGVALLSIVEPLRKQAAQMRQYIMQGMVSLCCGSGPGGGAGWGGGTDTKYLLQREAIVQFGRTRHGSRLCLRETCGRGPHKRKHRLRVELQLPMCLCATVTTRSHRMPLLGSTGVGTHGGRTAGSGQRRVTCVSNCIAS